MKIIDRKKTAFYFCAVVLLLLSFYLRVTGMFDVVHTDEDAVMDPVQTMSKNFSFDPDYYQRPNHVSIFVNFAVQNLYSVIRYGKLLAHTYDQHVPELFAIARVITALFGVFMIVLAFLIGSRFSRRIGSICAVLFAFFPIFANHSHLITPDIPTACITMLMILLTIKLVQRFDRLTFVFLCITCALNIIEKYPGLISICLVFYVLAVHDLKSNNKIKIRKFLPKIIKSGFLVLFFCYILSPSIFIHPKNTLYYLLKESKGDRLGSDGLGYFGNLLFYCKVFFTNAGILATCFFVVGLIRVFIQREQRSVKLPLLYGFLYWLVMSALALHWERWGMPMYIAPLFVIAFGVDALWGLKAAKIAAIPLFCVSILNMALISFFLSTNYHFATTQSLAKKYIEEQGITTDNTIYEGYTPFHEFGPSQPLEWFEKKDDPQYRFVITSSGMKDRFMAEPNRVPVRVKAYKEIDTLELLRSYTASDRPGYGWLEFQNFQTLPSYTFKVIRDGFNGYYKGPTLWIHRIR